MIKYMSWNVERLGDSRAKSIQDENGKIKKYKKGYRLPKTLGIADLGRVALEQIAAVIATSGADMAGIK